MTRRVTSLALATSVAVAALLSASAAGGRVGTMPPAGAPAVGGPAASTAATRTVAVGNNFFSPRRISIRRGDRVRWSWRSAGTAHNVTSSRFRGSATRSSGSFTARFTRTGRYPYHCTIHPGMNGTVVVRR
jgi:plastocyanin